MKTNLFIRSFFVQFFINNWCLALLKIIHTFTNWAESTNEIAIICTTQNRSYFILMNITKSVQKVQDLFFLKYLHLNSKTWHCVEMHTDAHTWFLYPLRVNCCVTISMRIFVTCACFILHVTSTHKPGPDPFSGIFI